MLHVTLHASDLAASEAFYDTVLATLGVERRAFSLAPATNDMPPTRGLHIGFAAPSQEHVDEFWQAGVEAGYRSDGEPGRRPEYCDDYYGSFLLDPDGNSAEAVHHDDLPSDSEIDHLWIRVADLDKSRRFYEELAPRTGFAIDAVHPDRVKFDGEDNVSFSVVAGKPTRNLHIAFPANNGSMLDPDGNTVEIASRVARPP